MNKRRIFIIVALLIVAYIFMQPTKVQAALQSNGGTPASYNINSWITGIRQMQATGQALGLTDEINGTNLTSTNTNLDIHMQKNTEYGAMVLLSASAYGKPDKVNNGETTTGNKTGVVMNINKEWVAAAPTNTAASSVANAKGRYKNYYSAPSYTEKVGDGVATTGAWHGASGNTWISGKNVFGGINVKYSCLIRGYSGSIFSYYGYGYYNPRNDYDFDDPSVCGQPADYRKTWNSRAVVVVGTGI